MGEKLTSALIALRTDAAYDSSTTVAMRDNEKVVRVEGVP
jgi:hypothetical protein